MAGDTGTLIIIIQSVNRQQETPVRQILEALRSGISTFEGDGISREESLCDSDGKESTCNAGDPGSTPGSGRLLGEGNGNPPQYSFFFSCFMVSFYFFIFPIVFISWRLITLQYCSGFCHTLT